MDQRGHGDAGKPRAGYSLRHFAEDIVAFMDAVGISSAVLVGSSSGGYVAQQVALTSLIIWGDRDELLTRAQEEALAAAIPGSRLVIYKDTGHLVLWEQPERVASDLIAFVESLPANTPDDP